MRAYSLHLAIRSVLPVSLLVRAGAAAALSLLCVAPAAAQSAPSPAPTMPPEIGRVSTSDRHDEPIGRSTRPTFVVDRAAIDAAGARSVADALKLVPGVTLTPYGAFGAQADYGIRGATSSQTLVLIDGTPLAAASNGIVDLGSYPTTGVQRIEVVESAGSTLYGSNAIGGIINIITGVPRTGARIAAGSYGERDAEIDAGTGNLGVAYERHVATNGYAYPAYRYSSDPSGNFAAGTRANAEALESAARVVYHGTLGRALSLRAEAGSNAITSNVPGGLSYLTPTATQPVDQTNGMVEIARNGAHASTVLTLSGARQNLAYDDPSIGGESVTYDGRAQVSLRQTLTGERGDLVAGADFSRESALVDLGPNGPPSSVDGRLAQSALYAQYAYAVAPGDRITAGLRGEHDAPFGSALIPSLGFAADLGQARIAANVGTAFRVPTLIDLYYPGYSNPRLQPERTRNLDLTIALPQVLGGVSAGFFERRGANLIVLDDNYVPQNAQHATIEGLMLTARTRPFHGVVADLSATDVYRASDDVTGARLRRNPVTRATVGLTRPFGTDRLAFGVHALVVGSSGENGTTLPITGVYDAYATVDAYVRYKVGAGAILSLRTFDLGNERPAPVYGYPAPGRRFQLELATH